MERSRTRRTRGRAEVNEEKPPVRPQSGRRKPSPARTKASPAKRASPARTKVSPARTKVSPVRRSSRPRSVAQVNATATKTVSQSSPIKEVKEAKSSPKSNSNLPSTLTTNTSSRAAQKSLTSTASVHSSYSSSTQKTVEIRSSAAADDKVIEKITEYIRRSVSKSLGDNESLRRRASHTPTTVTEGDSRYSRSVSRSVYDDDQSKAEFSDDEKKIEEDEEEHYKSFNSTQQTSAINLSPSNSGGGVAYRKLALPQEFGGVWGISTLLLIVPSLVYYLQWTCGKSSCDFKSINWSLSPDNLNLKYVMEKLFPTKAVISYLGYNFVLFLLSGLLFGKKVSVSAESSIKVYKFNALPIAILVTIAAGVAESLKYPVANFVVKHYLLFCIYGFINTFILAQWCYWRASLQTKDASTQLNPYGKTGNYLVDFGLGKQLNPKWLGLIDFKQAFYRISLITTLLFAECFLYKKVQIPILPADFPQTANLLETGKYYLNNLHYDAGAVFAASLLLFYIMDAIIFEHHLASSFELQGEGFGCLLLLRYAATPYLLGSVAKYFFDRRLPNITCKLAIYTTWTLLVLGLIIKRLSSAIKYKYRSNPSSPHFQNIETIHTFQGKRLLLGGLWGYLRQPNYTGDILALIALGLPMFLRFSWPPLISLALLITLILHRTIRVNARNIARYHSSWVRYCTRVPSYVVPKVY